LPSFGEKLKQEREKRKITLEEISSSTKIGTRMLQALEEDKFSQLPGGIFNKGFVRAYSRCVGLDEDQTVAEYLEASGDAPPPSAEVAADDYDTRESRDNNSRPELSPESPTRALPWGLFAAVLLAVALTLSLWSRRRREHAQPSRLPEMTTEARSSAAPPSPVQELPKNAPTAAQTQKSSPMRPAPPSPQPKAVPAAPIPSSTSTSSSTTASTNASNRPDALGTSPNTAAAPAPSEFTVVIHAREDSWISINADGRTKSELLAAGSDRTVLGRKEVIVRVGNAGGVDVLFNGKKLDSGGGTGEVKTVTFGPGGVVPNAPAPPPAL
jgi:cytoskeleton protein RodZ